MSNTLPFFRKYIFIMLAIGLSVIAGAQGIALDWAKSIGGDSPYGDGSSAVTTDKSGNVYITGYFRDTVDFDPGPGVYNMVANGVGDIFAAKLDAAGNFVWARQFGSDANSLWAGVLEFGNSIAVDTFGNVLVAGVFGDTADFDPGPGIYNLISNGGQGDAFVVKLDSDGNFIWARSWGDGTENGTNGTDQVAKVLTDAAGNVYTAGKFSGLVDFDPGPGSSLLSGNDGVYVSKLDADGNFVWATQVGANGICYARDMTMDADGNLYVCGNNDYPPPAGALWAGIGSGAFIWKVNSIGNLIWTYHVDTSPDPGSYATAIAVDNSGYLYLAGDFRSPTDFDPGPGTDTLQPTDPDQIYRDIFILKMDTSATNFIWLKHIGAPTGNEQVQGIAIDNSNNIYISGNFYGPTSPYTVDFDPGPGIANLSTLPTTTAWAGDAYLLKLDSAGNYKGAFSWGSADGSELGTAVHAGQHGEVYVTGSWGVFTGPATGDFDPGPGVATLSSNGYGDGYVQKFICADTTASLLTDTTCDSYTLNGETYTESGTYTQLLPNAEGCDSTITLHLTISVPEPIITVNEFVLGTTQPYTTYQWYLNGAPIEGATNSTYTVSENGDYTVEVTNSHGCTALSPIYTVTNATGINDINGIGSRIKIYPNPAKDVVYIESPVPVNATLSGIDGKVLDKAMHAKKMSLSGLAEGIYFLQLSDQKNHLIRVEKLVKQNQ